MPPLPEDTDEPSPASPRARRAFGLFGLVRSGRSVTESEATPAQVAERAASHALRLRLKEFEDLRVGDVMIPRAEVAAVGVNSTFRELIEAFAENAVSRLPLYRETLDDPVGFIHIKDIITEIAKGRARDDERPAERLRREMLYVPPSMRCADLLVKMQTRRMHIALVVDEYGGTDGLVTLEDLVEPIVGDIEDEHDEAEAPQLVNRGRGVWDADARAEIADFTEAAGIDLNLADFEDEFDTLGGLVYALSGKVPQRGELIKHPAGVDIEIVEADGRRIRRLRLRLPAGQSRPPEPEANAGGKAVQGE